MGKSPSKNLSSRNDTSGNRDGNRNVNDLGGQEYQQEFKIKSAVVQRDYQNYNGPEYNSQENERMNRTFNGVQQEVQKAADFEGFEKEFRPDLGVIDDRLNKMIPFDDKNNALEMHNNSRKTQYNVTKSLQEKLGNISISSVRSFVIESSNDPENQQQLDQQSISGYKLNGNSCYEKSQQENPMQENPKEEEFDLENIKRLLEQYNQSKKAEEQKEMKESSYEFTAEDEKRLNENLAHLAEAVEEHKRNQQNLSMMQQNYQSQQNLSMMQQSQQNQQNQRFQKNFQNYRGQNLSMRSIGYVNPNQSLNPNSNPKSNKDEENEQTQQRVISRNGNSSEVKAGEGNIGKPLEEMKKDPDHNPQKESKDFHPQFNYSLKLIDEK